MPQFEDLLKEMPTPPDVRMHAEGYALWMSWQGDLNPVVSQFMQEYGGLTLETSENQALLFFFSTSVFLAAARLESWARFDATTLTITIMPASLDMGGARAFRLNIAQELRSQSLETPDTFTVWVHPDAATAARSVPGISIEEKQPLPGLAPANWGIMRVDSRMPFQMLVGWYAILRPLGNPLDKDFQSGWRNLFEEVEKILQRNKFRYTIHDFSLMFPLESLRHMHTWVRSYLSLIAGLKAEHPQSYWPCVLAVVDKKGLTFNNDLPGKVGIDWNQLAADHPYMSFRNALGLGADFSVHEARFASGNGPDDWCNVSLQTEKDDGTSAIPMLTPASLALGENPACFYCGQRSHTMLNCPSRTLPERDKNIWKRIASLDFATMKEGMRSLDEGVRAGGMEALPALLARDDATGVMGKALFDINQPFQLRSIETMWRTRPKGPGDLMEADSHPVWELLQSYPTTEDRGAMERTIQGHFTRYPRDFRLKCLLGFIALERGDPQKAAQLWKDAESMAPAGFPQAWHLALQGRVAECLGKTSQAVPLYEQASRACPAWSFPAYRRIVCQVKTGFADSALIMLSSLLTTDANYFNMAIIDPEMERGQIQILTGLGSLWIMTGRQLAEEVALLQRLQNEISTWFTPDHDFAVKAVERISRLQDLTRYHNYVPYQAAMQGRLAIERDMQAIISRDSREFRNKFRHYLEKLAYIQREAAWFPFPRIMVEFNKNYNQCAASLNWAMKSNLHTPDAFRRALVMATDEEARIQKLERRLRLLRLIRDVTLFFLTLARTFFWIEVIGLLLVLVALPLVLYYVQKSGMNWPFAAIAGQQWQVQKAATFLVSFAALAFALLRTVLRFDKIRDALLEKARKAERVKTEIRKERATKRGS